MGKLDEPQSTDTNALHEGTRVGAFEILSRLGVGGMGEVYRARDLKLRRLVALKFLHLSRRDDLSSDERLLHEARLASALNHPHICTIYEVGEHDGRAFIAMELVEGISLQDRIAGGLSCEEAVRFAEQIASALVHAHEHHVVHRDLKPSNILVTSEGELKVLDFGVARRLAGEADVTIATMTVVEEGAAVGTVPYMAPEVVAGRKADERSDLWSLGVVLYEMLSGALPFQGTTRLALAAAILHGAPAPLPALTPEDVSSIVAKCLSRAPEERYRSAREVRAALEAVRRHPTARPPRARVPRSFATIAGVALLLVVGLSLVGRQWTVSRKPPADDAIRTIAVLPLRNLSGDEAQTYFAEGMTEAIITGLSRVGALRVSSHTAVMRYRGTASVPSQIARELRVQFLVEGGVLRSADRARVSVNLVDPRTGSNVWAQEFDQQIADVFALQGVLANAVVSAVQVQMTPNERDALKRARRVAPEVYDSYLIARHEAHKATLPSLLASIDAYKRALGMDSTFAPAYVGLGESYYQLSNWYWKPDSAMALVSESAERALAFDPSLAEAHTLQGIVAENYDWSWARSERAYQEAIRLNPSSASAHRWYGQGLIHAGRFEDASVEFENVLRLEPTLFNEWYAAWVPFYSGKYDSAETLLKGMLDRAPEFWPAWSLLGETYEMRQKYEPALEALERAKVDGNPWVLVAIARIHARQGRPSEARRELRLLEEMEGSRYVTPYGLATVYGVLEEKGRAYELLERAVRERCEDLTLLQVDPRLASLRGDPRLDRILALVSPRS